MAKKQKDVSIYISFLLRHKPEDIGLEMDNHGWVSADDLIDGINQKGIYTINKERLEELVQQENKGRYRFNKNHTKTKACQGHSIPWVESELDYQEPPVYLPWYYNGCHRKNYGLRRHPQNE